MDDKSDTRITRALAAADGDRRKGRSAARPSYLIVVSGGIPGAMIRLSAEGARVGRSSDCQVRVPDLSVSRFHATIGIDAQRAAWLTDLGSTNGTFLNNRQVAPHKATRLSDGDRLQFGSGLVAKYVALDPRDEQFQRDLFERTVKDALTGLYNRSYFLGQVDATAAESAARGHGLAVILLDIDHFKRVNDTFGHDAGDLVLKEVAQVLRDCTRSQDLVARYGGEEFVLALPAATPAKARLLAERIRAAIEARRPVVNGDPLRVTASLGLAFAGATRQRPADVLVTEADGALYQAKEAGRNRVVCKTASTPRAVDSGVMTPREA